MRFANEAAATVFRVLDKCSCELSPDGPWRWKGAVQNGTRLPISASFDEGFLQLASRPGMIRKSANALERALLGNGEMTGGVRLALDGASGALHLRSDILLLDETQLLDRFHWALDGFHHGAHLLKSLDSDSRYKRAEIRRTTASGINLAELLRETKWTTAERGPNDYSVELDAASAPPATIRLTESGVVASVELVRSEMSAENTRRALAVFLLTTSSVLRMARAYAVKTDEQMCCGFQVGLPHAPAAEEIDDALAALSVAHRNCARETSVLLNDLAARRYLSAREYSTTEDHQPEKEN
jgi:hypothetical protein